MQLVELLQVKWIYLQTIEYENIKDCPTCIYKKNVLLLMLRGLEICNSGTYFISYNKSCLPVFVRTVERTNFYFLCNANERTNKRTY